MFFFFNDTATTEIYTLSLHDALPIYFQTDSGPLRWNGIKHRWTDTTDATSTSTGAIGTARSEEHTSELQSQSNLVCRLLLEKKNKQSLYRHRDHIII